MSKHNKLSEVLRPRELPNETGLSRTTCWRLEKDPSSGFPQRIKLTPNGTAVGYIRSEIVRWRESRPTVISNKSNDTNVTVLNRANDPTVQESSDNEESRKESGPKDAALKIAPIVGPHIGNDSLAS